MRKYDEVMEHVQVTDEMQKRILSNVEAHFSGKKKIVKWQRWVPAIGAVAAAAVVVCSVGMWNHRISGLPAESSPAEMMEGIYNAQEYGSVQELAAAEGFSIPELSSIPFEVVDTSYTLIENELAEVRYTGNSDAERVIFRKAPGTEDISGDYTVYDAVESAQIAGADVTLKGDGSLIFLACWTDGQYSYSIGVDCGCSKEEMDAMIQEAAGAETGNVPAE